MPELALNIAEMRDRARQRLPHGLFEFVERGAEDDRALCANRAAFSACQLRSRILRGVEVIDQSVTLFGRKAPSPFAIAPTGAAAMLWHQGDLALARAAAAADVPFTVATSSSVDIETLADAGGRLWFQLYLWQDQALSDALIDRAQAAGCEALIVTADFPVPANREFMDRNGFQFPFRPGAQNAVDILSHPRWLWGVLLRYALNGGMPGQANLPGGLRTSFTKLPPPGLYIRNAGFVWDDVATLRARWKGPLLVKGILHPDDAIRAVALGADGIIVSNHGGRSMDAALPSLAALSAIVDAVGGKTTILLDSGVQRGSDIVKGLAMGADAVMVGRAPLYGLAADGEVGVRRALTILNDEVARVMAQTGSRTVAEITHDLIYRAG